MPEASPDSVPPIPGLTRYRLPSPFTFHDAVAETRGVSLLFFVTESCGACRRWKTLLREMTRPDGSFIVFEVDALHDAALANEFGVFHLPAIFLFLDGHYHCRIESEAQEAQLQSAIACALARIAEDPP